jgi:2-keto-4-pentenoate hydratase/2-oxohepta-3-ene-1,7-dioic acid hydratase in catechol pathway
MHTIMFDGAAFAPSKIVCVGRNYVAHIEELGNEIPDDMVVFNKPNSAISGQLRAQIDGETLHYEGEIALLIGAGKIVGVGFGLDLTRRELQSRLKANGLPWERAKAFDGAALFSEFVPAPANISSLSLRLTVNDELRQAGGVGLMIYPPAEILRELRKFTTLEDGDIVMTGTPAGVGAIHPQDSFRGALFGGARELVSASWRAQ